MKGLLLYNKHRRLDIFISIYHEMTLYSPNVSWFSEDQAWTLIVSRPGNFVPGELDKFHSATVGYHTRYNIEYV